MQARSWVETAGASAATGDVCRKIAKAPRTKAPRPIAALAGGLTRRWQPAEAPVSPQTGREPSGVNNPG